MKIIIPYFICFISIVATSVCVQSMSSRVGSFIDAQLESLDIEADMILVWEGEMIIKEHFSNTGAFLEETDYRQYLTQRYSPIMAEYLKKDFYFMFLKS